MKLSCSTSSASPFYGLYAPQRQTVSPSSADTASGTPAGRAGRTAKAGRRVVPHPWLSRGPTAVLALLPVHVGHAGVAVEYPAKHKQQIGEPVEIALQSRG